MSSAIASGVLRPVLPRTAGFDPDGLARLEEIVRDGLDAVYPAAALLIARRGGVVLHSGYGYVEPARRQRPARTDSLYDLASVSKLFTVTAFMTLVEARVVALDTPVADVLPAFGGTRPIGPVEDPRTQTPLPADPAFAGQAVDARQVTFLHLLTHTSGLAAWRSLFREGTHTPGDVPLPHRVSTQARAQRVAAIWERYGFAYPPGRHMVYSDLGLILLGEAIARLAEMPLDAYVQRSVLAPLDLAHTTYNPLAHAVPPEQIVPTEHCTWRRRRCHGEVHDENAASLGGVAGHAGLFSTVWDVAVLGQATLNGGCYGGARLLSPQTVSEMTREQVNFGDRPRGLGWLRRSRERSSAGRRFGPHSYGHTGFTGTSLWIDPDRELVVALLTNRVYGGRDPAGIARLRPRLHDAIVEAIA